VVADHSKCLPNDILQDIRSLPSCSCLSSNKTGFTWPAAPNSNKANNTNN